MEVLSLFLPFTHSLCISLKIQTIKLENRNWNYNEAFWSLVNIWPSLHLQPIINPMIDSYSQELILFLLYYFHGHSYSLHHSGLYQFLIYPNVFNLVKHSCKYTYFVASHLWMTFLVPKDLFFPRSSLINLLTNIFKEVLYA